MAEDHFRQMEGIFSTHPAMAEGAWRLVEQVTIGRIVHVNVVLVGEAKLHDAEHECVLPVPE